MNRVELRGAATKDAPLEFLPSGDPALSFQLAVNGTRWDREARQAVVKTAYFWVNVYSTLAEQIEDAGGIQKGDDVYIVGELTQAQTKNRDVPSTRITAFQVTVLRKKAGRGVSRPTPAPIPEDPWA